MSQYQFTVSVKTSYLPEQSDPDRRQYAFAYTLTIRNTGHQPLLQPGEHFEYTSWAVIATPVGTMRGAYFCVAEDGERFEAPVDEFALHMPRTLH
jgi:ApaG protein